jgi:hypothetical protein
VCAGCAQGAQGVRRVCAGCAQGVHKRCAGSVQGVHKANLCGAELLVDNELSFEILCPMMAIQFSITLDIFLVDLSWQKKVIFLCGMAFPHAVPCAAHPRNSLHRRVM